MASLIAPDQTFLDPASVGKFLESSVSHETFRNKRILLIVPDSTRTAPVGMVFKHLFEQHHAEVKSMDVLIALGTHQPMSEKAICDRLEISIEERKEQYEKVQFFNHEWDNPEALQQIGTITSEEISDLTKGRFSMEVPVREQTLIRLRPNHHHWPRFPSRGGWIFRGEQVFVSRCQRPRGSKFFPLAGGNYYQPQDHRS